MTTNAAQDKVFKPRVAEAVGIAGSGTVEAWLEAGRLANEEIERLRKDAHPGSVLRVTAILDNSLRRLIALHLPGLYNCAKAGTTLEKRIFNGPLRNNSARIDMAAAMNLIDSNTARTLHIIRDIRNAFAHSDEELNFGSDSVLEKLKLIGKIDGNAEKAHSLFLSTVVTELSGLLDSIKSRIDNVELIKALERYSLDKSASAGQE